MKFFCIHHQRDFSCIKAICIALFLLNFCETLYAQDAHFSQFYEAPLLLNPARTGFFTGQYRIIADYKSQWSNFITPYKTLTGSVDLNLPVSAKRKSSLGLGIIDFADKGGDIGYTTNVFGAALAYHLALDSEGYRSLGGGIEAGFGNTTFNLSDAVFDENYDGGSVTEAITSTRASFFDLNVGFEYNYIDSNSEWNVGLALFHANRPQLNFFDQSGSYINRKWIVSGGAAFHLSPKTEIFPRGFFAYQNPFYDITVGADLKSQLLQSRFSDYSLYFGLYYWVNNAIIAKIRIDLDDISFAFSYDITTSSIAVPVKYAGGPEISITLRGSIFKGNANVFNPRF